MLPNPIQVCLIHPELLMLSSSLTRSLQSQHCCHPSDPTPQLTLHAAFGLACMIQAVSHPTPHQTPITCLLSFHFISFPSLQLWPGHN